MPLDFGANRLTDTQSVKTKQLREIREKNEQLAEVNARVEKMEQKLKQSEAANRQVRC